MIGLLVCFLVRLARCLLRVSQGVLTSNLQPFTPARVHHAINAPGDLI